LENTYCGFHEYCKCYFKIEYNFILIHPCLILAEFKNHNTFQHFLQISGNFSAVLTANIPRQNFIIRVLIHILVENLERNNFENRSEIGRESVAFCSCFSEAGCELPLLGRLEDCLNKLVGFISLIIPVTA